jgi:hypothetical protein
MVSLLESTHDAELLVGIGLAGRTADGQRFRAPPGGGEGGHLLASQPDGLLAYWEPEQIGKGTTGVAVIVDPARIVRFVSDQQQHLVIVRVTPGTPFVYYAGACWDRGLDVKTWDQWLQYLREFQPDFDPGRDF